jgi:hypothetical protein
MWSAFNPAPPRPFTEFLESNLGKKSRPSFKKRRKELARQQKQQDKVANRRAKTEAKSEASRKSGDEDPDLIGIQPGPQALPDEWQDLPDGGSSPDPTEDES